MRRFITYLAVSGVYGLFCTNFTFLGGKSQPVSLLRRFFVDLTSACDAGAPSAGSTDVIGVLAALEAAVERQPLCQRTRADWWTTQPTFFSALAQPDPEPGAEQHSAAQAGSEIRLTDSAIEVRSDSRVSAQHWDYDTTSGEG